LDSSKVSTVATNVPVLPLPIKLDQEVIVVRFAAEDSKKEWYFI